MGRAADLAGTHFKTLNALQGPGRARHPRARATATPTRAAMQASLVPPAEPHRARGRSRRAPWPRAAASAGVATAETAADFERRAVRAHHRHLPPGPMHVGEQKEAGGRLGDAAAPGLSAACASLGFQLGRFKTGTPARLRRDHRLGRAASRSRATWSAAAARCAPTERAPLPLPAAADLPLTYTTEATHASSARNLHRSPLYQGEIVGRGPRYCPSLEDKVVRFADTRAPPGLPRARGARTRTLVYPAGSPRACPADVQLEFLRTIPGLERVEVVRYGYAVEYDYAPPTQLQPTLETQARRGPVLRRAAQRHVGLRGGRVPGPVRRHQRGPAGEGPGSRAGARPARGAWRGAAGRPGDEGRGRAVPDVHLALRASAQAARRERGVPARDTASAWGWSRVRSWKRTEAREARIQGELKRLEKERLSRTVGRPEVTYAWRRSPDSSLEARDADEVEVRAKYQGTSRRLKRRGFAGLTCWTRGASTPAGFTFKAVRGLSAEATERLERASRRRSVMRVGCPASRPPRWDCSSWVYLKRTGLFHVEQSEAAPDA